MLVFGCEVGRQRQNKKVAMVCGIIYCECGCRCTCRNSGQATKQVGIADGDGDARVNVLAFALGHGELRPTTWPAPQSTENSLSSPPLFLLSSLFILFLSMLI